MNYFICYDICDPKRLRMTAKILESYGIRVQYSFFEIETSKKHIDDMLLKIRPVLDLSEDRLYVYPICSDCRRKTVIEGTGAVLGLQTFRIL